jgi:hypothetical protein
MRVIERPGIERTLAEDGPPAPTLEERAAASLYGQSFVAGEIDHRAPELFDGLGEDEAQRAERRERFVAIGDETGLPDTITAMLAQGEIDGELARGRVRTPTVGRQRLNVGSPSTCYRRFSGRARTGSGSRTAAGRGAQASKSRAVP